MLQLILGGVRSGKSSLAERLCQESGKQVIYVATATAGDDEMTRRIARHRADRPDQWPTVEEPIALAAALSAYDDERYCIMVDCLTLWLTNNLLDTKDSWQTEKAKLLQQLSTLRADVIFVSNEVGLGIVPMGSLSRRFSDEAGWLHQELAARCDRVVMVVAGLPQVLKGPPLD
ncbi:adenosylcobinamide kinase /adenosylcobinamide-phosphate guanylyltransferase [Sinobacterium caligoides]|uniref:Bifunctional adenosylcobalamin biosynthesis protein n=1 Tax=Sinobacterium caligoides TaxID=933926 RepID=A0A3N2E197_9GAMM|nr:bifunctional adenosylcobinamide kinase/adenosylcobinamide-phosphate guanylyltransferase [Sinobacterium caligoides]ROS05345.1 adenosylcobinamide kinase /adenosylcobinamide-phosphate guanylyltransferase [Sinobacterium caligoides]